MRYGIKSKALLDNGKVRLTIDEHNFTIEELPRKPCKQTLRATHINTYWAVVVAHRDDFIPSNIMNDVALDFSDDYDTVVTLIQGCIAGLKKRPGNEEVERYHGVSVQKSEHHYTKVTPEGVDPIEIQLKDTVLRCTWTKFECWSPGSTMSYGRDGEPHYSMIEQRSEAAARKLYKLVQDEKVRAEIAELGWGGSGIWGWLREKKISFEVCNSTW